MRRRVAAIWVAWCCVALLCASGCRAPQQYIESLKGDGFPEWSDSLGGSVRGANPNAKPSGFFTDRRSEQIEQSLGGGF
jgi:hypothetical protein